MTARHPVRWLLTSLCALLLGVGATMVVLGSRETPPQATPTPRAESSISREEAQSIPRAQADAPIETPAGDLGPYVRSDPVDRIWDDVLAGTRTEGLPVSTLVIPSLDIQAPITSQPVADDAMTLPDDLAAVGHLDTTADLDADAGATLLAGHVTQGGDHGALFLLGMVRPGASVITTDAEGAATVWAVTSVRSYSKTALPEEIFATDGDRILSAVTCGGELLRTSDGRWTHEDNIVVTAEPWD